MMRMGRRFQGVERAIGESLLRILVLREFTN